MQYEIIDEFIAPWVPPNACAAPELWADRSKPIDSVVGVYVNVPPNFLPGAMPDFPWKYTCPSDGTTPVFLPRPRPEHPTYVPRLEGEPFYLGESPSFVQRVAAEYGTSGGAWVLAYESPLNWA